jgi:hypothetical protein
MSHGTVKRDPWISATFSTQRPPLESAGLTGGPPDRLERRSGVHRRIKEGVIGQNVSINLRQRHHHT